MAKIVIDFDAITGKVKDALSNTQPIVDKIKSIDKKFQIGIVGAVVVIILILLLFGGGVPEECRYKGVVDAIIWAYEPRLIPNKALGKVMPTSYKDKDGANVEIDIVDSFGNINVCKMSAYDSSNRLTFFYLTKRTDKGVKVWTFNEKDKAIAVAKKYAKKNN